MQCPTKVSHYKNTTYLVLCFVKSLPWLFNRNLLTESKYLFIAILCAKMLCVNKTYNICEHCKWCDVHVKSKCLTLISCQLSGVNFNNVLRAAFTFVRSQKCKKHWWLDCLFCAFGIFTRKSCALNIGETDPWSLQTRIEWDRCAK